MTRHLQLGDSEGFGDFVVWKRCSVRGSEGLGLSVRRRPSPQIRGVTWLTWLTWFFCIILHLRSIWMFPKIGGKPPKWMVKIMENLIKMDDLGGNPPIFGNTLYFHIFSHIFTYYFSMLQIIAMIIDFSRFCRLASILARHIFPYPDVLMDMQSAISNPHVGSIGRLQQLKYRAGGSIQVTFQAWQRS